MDQDAGRARAKGGHRRSVSLTGGVARWVDERAEARGISRSAALAELVTEAFRAAVRAGERGSTGETA